MELDLCADDVTRAEERLCSFTCSTDPPHDYKADVEDLLSLCDALDSCGSEYAQHYLFKIVTRSLDVNAELAQMQPVEPAEASLNLDPDPTSTVQTSCPRSKDEPQAKRRCLQADASEPPSTDSNAAPHAYSYSELAADIETIAIAALKSGIGPCMAAIYSPEEAEALSDEVFALLDHPAFEDHQELPELEAALLQSLTVLKNDLTEVDNWLPETCGRKHSQQLEQIIVMPGIHPALMHAAVRAIMALAPRAMHEEDLAAAVLDVLCDDAAYATDSSGAINRLADVLLYHYNSRHRDAIERMLYTSAPQLLPCLTQAVQRVAATGGTAGCEHSAMLLVTATRELGTGNGPLPDGLASLVHAATEVLVDAVLVEGPLGRGLPALRQLLGFSDAAAEMLHARLLAATSVHQVAAVARVMQQGFSMPYHRDRTPERLAPLLEPLSQRYVAWQQPQQTAGAAGSTAGAEAEAVGASAAAGADMDSAAAAEASAAAHVELTACLEDCCRSIYCGPQMSSAASLVFATPLLHAAIRAQHWGLASQAALVLQQAQVVRGLPHRRLIDGWCSDDKQNQQVSSTAAAALQLLLAGSHSSRWAGQCAATACTLVRVLREYGCGSKAGLQQLLASSGLISQLYSTVAQGAEQCLAQQAQAASAEAAGAGAAAAAQAAQAVEVAGGVLAEFRFIDSDLLQDPCLPQLGPMLQELERSRPSMAEVSHKLQLLWAAAAVHSPALLATVWGHQGLLALLMQRPSRDNTKDLYYSAQHVAEMFSAFRWLLSNDPSFASSPGLRSISTQSLADACEPWLQHCFSLNSEEGVCAAALVAAAMYQQQATQSQLHGEYGTPVSVSPGQTIGKLVDQLLGQAASWASSELVQQSMAEALLACAGMLQQCQQQEERDDGTGRTEQQGARLHARVNDKHLLPLLGFCSSQSGAAEPNSDAAEANSDAKGMHRLWSLLGAAGSDEITATDAAAARVLALLLGMGCVAAPGAAEQMSAQALGVLAQMLVDRVVAEQQQQQQQQQEEEGEAEQEDCGTGPAGAQAGPAGGAAAVADVAVCLGEAVTGRPQLQLLLLRLAAVPPAIATMLAVPHMVPDGLRLLQALASSRATVQRLVVAQPALLQGLLALLQQVQGDDVPVLVQAQAKQVLVLLRTMVLGNGSAQLTVARVPGMCAALVQLLACGEDELGSEAAETLAALQHDSSEALALVKGASQAVVMVL